MARNHVKAFSLSDADIEKVRGCLFFGMTNDQIAQVFGISRQTYERAEKRLPEEQKGILKTARDYADSQVVAALFRRATGGNFGGEYIPPDVTACIFWLKNRQKEQWSDRKDPAVKVDFSGCGVLKVSEQMGEEQWQEAAKNSR